jgi:chromate transporter
MRLAGGLAAVTASVVGVIANLAVWFSVHVLFAVTVTLRAGPAALDLPVPGSVQPWAAMLAGLAAVLLFMLRENVARTLAACALLGLAAKIV